MTRRKKSKAAKAIEAEIVALTSEEDEKPAVNTTELFHFGTMNVHVIQEHVLGETLQGVPFTLNDFELKMFSDNIFFIERKLGESVVGRVYTLTDEHLAKMDEYMTDKYKREDIEQGTKTFQTYLLREIVK